VPWCHAGCVSGAVPRRAQLCRRDRIDRGMTAPCGRCPPRLGGRGAPTRVTSSRHLHSNCGAGRGPGGAPGSSFVWHPEGARTA
jgi:hypothetical protein